MNTPEHRGVSSLFPEKSDMEENLRYRATGGEHVVYDMLPQEWRGQVLKINYDSIRNLFRDNDSKGRPLGDASSAWKTHYENEVSRRQKEHRELREYFGYHVPEQHSQIATIPISPEQIMAVFARADELPPKEYETVREVPAVITLQEKILFDEKKGALSFHFGNLDLDALSSSDLVRMKDDFYFRARSRIDHTAEIQRIYPSLQPVIERIQQDPSAKEKIRQFTEQMIAYTKDTGKGLDLYGHNNVIFYGDEGTWDYRLIDTIQGDGNAKDFLQEASIFHQWKAGVKTDTNIDDVAPDNVHYLRGINALAWLVDSSSRLDEIKEQEIQSHIEEVVAHLQTKINKR